MAMRNLMDEIRTKVMVSDGAWGTFLIGKGLKPGTCPESWNLSHPEEVMDIARAYLEAGASLVKTNTFGANAFKLGNYGLEKRVREINREGARLSREAAGDRAYVLGSVGPTGKFLMMGDTTYEAMYGSFAEQCAGLQEGGADAILIETMSDPDEVLCAIKAAKENTGLCIISTLTFEKSQQGGYYTLFGQRPAELVPLLKEAGADMLGANCGSGLEGMIAIVREMRAIDQDIPIVIHANAGMPVYADGTTKYPDSPADMAGMVPALIEAGANMIGGCCGTTPDHIRKIKDCLPDAGRNGGRQ